jgi:hypothetical protein
MPYTPKYTSEELVEALLQTIIDNTSVPTSSQLLTWIEEVEKKMDADLQKQSQDHLHLRLQHRQQDPSGICHEEGCPTGLRGLGCLNGEGDRPQSGALGTPLRFLKGANQRVGDVAAQARHAGGGLTWGNQLRSLTSYIKSIRC